MSYDYNWKTYFEFTKQIIFISAITCDPSRTAPTNGNVSCTNTNQFGSVCTYTCNSGYALSNNSLTNTTCNDDGDNDADGEWSSNPPECIGKFFVHLNVTK